MVEGCHREEHAMCTPIRLDEACSPSDPGHYSTCPSVSAVTRSCSVSPVMYRNIFSATNDFFWLFRAPRVSSLLFDVWVLPEVQQTWNLLADGSRNVLPCSSQCLARHWIRACAVYCGSGELSNFPRDGGLWILLSELVFGTLHPSAGPWVPCPQGHGPN